MIILIITFLFNLPLLSPSISHYYYYFQLYLNITDTHKPQREDEGGPCFVVLNHVYPKHDRKKKKIQ